MKQLKKYLLILPMSLLLAACCFNGNCPDEDIIPRDSYSPVIISREQLEASIFAQPAQSTTKSGKIYIKGNYMYITEVNKGFHVYNYANPENAIKTAFINVPGATDLAIRNNIIYINQAVDLVTLNYDQTSNTIVSSHRNRNVFPTKVGPNGEQAYPNRDEIVIDWTLN